MKTIDLSDLPFSKKFMEQAKFTDDWTGGSDKEFGFKFCKPNDEIIVDEICRGTKCKITITPRKCSNNSDSFHTHPNSIKSKHSVVDLYNAVARSYLSNKPVITCVKALMDEDVFCRKVDGRKLDVVKDIKKLRDEFREKPTIENYEEIISKIDNKTLLSSIKFKI